MRASICILSLIVVMCICAEDERDRDETSTLRFYYGSVEKFIELPLQDAREIFNTDWYNGSIPTVIYTHGFRVRQGEISSVYTYMSPENNKIRKPEGPAVLAVLSAYLAQGASNVALLNWSKMAAGEKPNLPNAYTTWAAPNSRKLGATFADALLSLQASGLALQQTHLVGHSLGAQLFGNAGNNLLARGVRLPWITGLDPASRDFENRPLSLKLHAHSADFVDIIHSDPSKYGYRRAFGSVDFWPNFRNNGPVRQPGCDTGPQTMFSAGDICSHNRCWELLVESLKYPGAIVGSHARNYRTWRNYTPPERHQVTFAIGQYPNNSTLPGNYYFTTSGASPFGLGEEGL